MARSQRVCARVWSHGVQSFAPVLPDVTGDRSSALFETDSPASGPISRRGMAHAPARRPEARRGFTLEVEGSPPLACGEILGFRESLVALIDPRAQVPLRLGILATSIELDAWLDGWAEDDTQVRRTVTLRRRLDGKAVTVIATLASHGFGVDPSLALESVTSPRGSEAAEDHPQRHLLEGRRRRGARPARAREREQAPGDRAVVRLTHALSALSPGAFFPKQRRPPSLTPRYDDAAEASDELRLAHPALRLEPRLPRGPALGAGARRRGHHARRQPGDASAEPVCSALARPLPLSKAMISSGYA